MKGKTTSEYKVISTTEHDRYSLEKELNKLGTEGWDIVPGAYVTQTAGEGTRHKERVDIIIMRRVREGSD